MVYYSSVIDTDSCFLLVVSHLFCFQNMLLKFRVFMLLSLPLSTSMLAFPCCLSLVEILDTVWWGGSPFFHWHKILTLHLTHTSKYTLLVAHIGAGGFCLSVGGFGVLFHVPGDGLELGFRYRGRWWLYLLATPLHWQYCMIYPSLITLSFGWIAM